MAEIGDNLTEKIGQFAMLAQGIAPVTSVYAAENSPKAISALLSIAKRNPKLLAGLQRAADGVDALELAKFIGGLVTAIRVDAQQIKGDEPVARAFGVTAVLEEYFWQNDTPLPNPGVTVQTPPAYVPV